MLNFHLKISTENRFLTHFVSDLPEPLSFYAALENNTIFLQQFFRGGYSPLSPLGAPDYFQIDKNIFLK